MLDKIKVYRRSDSLCIRNYLLDVQGQGTPEETISLCLPYHGSGERAFLTKTDPLNKFKKEMEGWWFCEEYVVIINEIPYLIDYSQEKRCYRPEYEYLRSSEITIWPKGQGYGNTTFIQKEKFREVKDFIEIELGIVLAKFDRNTKKYDIEHVRSIFYSIGEEKYLKLLELINS